MLLPLSTAIYVLCIGNFKVMSKENFIPKRNTGEYCHAQIVKRFPTLFSPCTFFSPKPELASITLSQFVIEPALPGDNQIFESLLLIEIKLSDRHF